MKFLIANAAVEFAWEGAEMLSLTGAPLVGLGRDGTAGPEVLDRLLDRVTDWLEPVYGFRARSAFKAKFRSAYRGPYLAYPESAALPLIATAIGRAYRPHLTTPQTVAVLRTVVDGLRVANADHRRVAGRNGQNHG